MSVVKKFEKNPIQNFMLENICIDEYQNISIENDEKYYNIEWNVVRQYLLDVSQPCNEMILTCRFGYDFYNCSEIFDTVLTDEGINIQSRSLRGV